MYIPLHWHSTFSFLEALWQPKDIVKRVKSLWMNAVAITDYNGMFAVPSLFLACEDSKDKDNPDDFAVKPIFWLEIWFVYDLKSSLIWKAVWNICLIAENDIWYHNMMEMVAYANQDWLSNWTSKLDFNILKQKSEWTILFFWWELSWLVKMLSAWDSEDTIMEIFNKMREIYWDNLFMEIIAQDELVLPLVWKSNKIIYDFAHKTNTKLIVNNDYRYINPNDKEVWEVALSIKDWTKMYDANRRKPEWKYYIMNWEEIKDICVKNWYNSSEVDERIENNWSIADRVNTSMLLHQKLFPKYETPENIKIYYDKYWTSSIVDN